MTRLQYNFQAYEDATGDLNQFCNTKGINIQDIYSIRRCKHAVHDRRRAAKHLRDQGYSLPIIGDVMRKHHTTILHYLRKDGHVKNKLD